MIDLTNFIESKNRSMVYELTGIVSITKEQNNFIFVCFCKSPIDKQWYLYKDEEVQNINLNTVLYWHNLNNNYIPCILGYQIKN